MNDFIRTTGQHYFDETDLSKYQWIGIPRDGYQDKAPIDCPEIEETLS